MSGIALIVTTISDCEAGASLVKSLLQRRVIACGQILQQGRSLYHWKGEMRDEIECTVVLKTALFLKDHVVDEVRKYHSYELPEIIVIDAEASPEYAMWVIEEVQKV